MIASQARYRIECPASACFDCGDSGVDLKPRRDAFLCLRCRCKPHNAYGPFELNARTLKVFEVVKILTEANWTPEQFEAMTEHAWALLAGELAKRGIRCRRFSMETRAAVASAMNDSMERGE